MILDLMLIATAVIGATVLMFTPLGDKVSELITPKEGDEYGDC